MKYRIDAFVQHVEVHREQVAAHELIGCLSQALFVSLASSGCAHEVSCIAQGCAEAEPQAPGRASHESAPGRQKRNTSAAALIPAAVPNSKALAPGWMRPAR